MKRTAIIFCTVAAVLVSGGCKKDDPDKTPFGNKIYLATESKTVTTLLKKSLPETMQVLRTATPKPASEAITIEYGVDSLLVDFYNKAYYDKAVLLPEANYTFSSKTATISKGTALSTDIDLYFRGLDQLPNDKTYVLPVSIRHTSSLDVLKGNRSVFYVFKAGALINVAADMEKNYCTVTWKNPSIVKEMKAITMEALVNAKYLSRKDDDSHILSIMGVEDTYLLRCGDTNAPGQLQVSGPNRVKFPNWDANKVLPVKEWVHVALTQNAATGDYVIYVNGVEQSRGNAWVGGQISLAGNRNSFFVGRSWNDNRWWPGMMSEVRIWNVVRTQQQIQDNRYEVDPKSEGLVCYWKFNQGGGAVITDETGNGNDLRANSAVKWIPVQLPAIK